MDNLHLFELLNAPPGLSAGHLLLATVLAQWVIGLLPVAMLVAWVRGDQASRLDLLQMLLAVLIALGIAQAVSHLWPQPRPFALHIGTQYLAHSNEPGLPSDHVTVFWSLAIASFRARRFAVWAFPLLALGLLVGWSRVYLGVHFPFDILAAFPVALIGVGVARLLRKPVLPLARRIEALYDRFAPSGRSKLRSDKL